MRVTIITSHSTAVEPAKAVVEFDHDSEALTELWRLASDERRDLLDLSWERSDGAEALQRWADER